MGGAHGADRVGCRRRPRRGELQGAALQHLAQRPEVPEVLGAEESHEDAAVGPVHQQALLAQRPERLAQGVARDAEGRAEGLLGQLLARTQPALEGERAQDGRDLLRRRRAGCERHGVDGDDAVPALRRRERRPGARPCDGCPDHPLCGLFTDA